MTESRKTLSLKLSSGQDDRIEEWANALRQAITHHLCVRWTYNKVPMQAAPMILYRKHGDLHVDALVLEKHGEPSSEVKLAAFKLAGLSNVAVTMEPISDPAVPDRNDPRYAEGIDSILD
jgi:hypothetical protein